VAEKVRKPLVLLWLPYTSPKTSLEFRTFLIKKNPKRDGLGTISTLGAKTAFVGVGVTGELSGVMEACTVLRCHGASGLRLRIKVTCAAAPT
jgi:hypothetical protein